VDRQKLATAEATTASRPPTSPALSVRQLEVLNLIVLGRSNKEIARILKLGPGTVKVHVSALFGKLGIRRRAALAVMGARLSAEAVERSEFNSRPRVECPSSARITWDKVADFLFSLPESEWHRVGR
jgi:DNA-binding CsgD family transcriptional regulator